MSRRSLRLAVGVLMALAACRGGGGGDVGSATDHTSGKQPSSSLGAETSLPATSGPSCPTIPARAEPPADRPRYVLGVDITPAEGLVRGDLKVAFTPDLPTDELVLRLWANGPRLAVAGARMETGPVTVDGVVAPTTRADATTLLVDPGRTIAPGTTVDVATTWTLFVPGPANDRIAHDEDSMRLGSFFPILPWEPGVGWAREAAVGDFAEASTAPTADFDLTVTVPDGYQILASGEPVASDPNNPAATHFKATAMRDVAISVGRFGDLVTAVANAPDPVQVTVGVHDGVPGQAQQFLDEAVAVLEAFGEHYGPYPWTTLTLAVTPGLGGGIEYPSHIMLGPFTEGDITAHEVGHMWFYSLVGNDQGRDPWLDEGLTTWAEARYQGTLDLYAMQDIPRVAAGHLGEPMSFWTIRPLYYQDGVYTQGAQALGSLGPPEMVDCALRVYVAQNAYRIATPADLVAAASAVFPDAAEKLAGFGITP